MRERDLVGAPAGLAGMAAISGCGEELQATCVALYYHCTQCCCLQRICARGVQALTRYFGYARPQVDVIDMSLNSSGPFWEIVQTLRAMLLDGFLGEGKLVLVWFANNDSLGR